MAKKNLYDEYSIVTETPRAFTRRVPSTYLGSSRTNTNLIKEIFANAVDEHAIGHGDKISITVDTAKNIYTVEDNGQGFLVNAGIDDDGETILQRSFDKLNTSGKTSADGVYEGTALGLNGIGAKLTNWLSKKLIVTTYREGEFEELTFIDGIFKNRKVGKAKRESGTIVTWSPDPQFFQANEPDIAMLKSHFEIIAALCPKLTIVLNYNGKESIYQEQGGLNSYVDCKVKGKEIFSNRFVTERNIDVTYYKPKEYPGLVLKDGDFNKNNEYIYDRSYDVRVGDEGSSVSPKHTVDTIKKSDCTTDVRQEKISICMTYTSDYSENIDAYVNLGHTDAGAHIQAFHTAFVRAINKYATDAGWLKKNDKNFNINEISEGLYVIFNMTTTTARYDAQNKSRIDDIDARSINAVIGGDFATWLMNSPSDAKIIVDRAMTARRAREAAQRAKEKIRDASNGKGAKSIFADLPTKLSDAYPKNKKDRSRCELYICEGDSAASSINAVKNSEFQATFPIRGKVLNCQKASTAQVYGNAEIAGITKALGLDIDKTTGKLIYDTKKLRYDKIIIASDEDVDGLDIASLLLTVFNWICPELIEHGHIYHVHGALFKVIYSDKSYELFQTEAELEAWKKKNKKSYTLTRAKGLGELTKDETKGQLVNPATRNLHQLIATDMNLFNEYLEMTKGPDAGPRKDYLEEHFNDYEE